MTGSADPVQEERQALIRSIARGVLIRNSRVLDAMRQVPREKFVPSHLANVAYRDSALPIDAGQTISQPRVVAIMADALDLGPADRVLEVGAGSGYSAAVMSKLCREVYSVEWHANLADEAAARLKALGITNVFVRQGDGTAGWAHHAPFDAISVAAGGGPIPKPLLAQLAVGGKLVMPVSDARDAQQLLVVTKKGANEFSTKDLGSVRFVPLLGDQFTP